jgi:hypothetical protein
MSEQHVIAHEGRLGQVTKMVEAAVLEQLKIWLSHAQDEGQVWKNPAQAVKMALYSVGVDMDDQVSIPISRALSEAALLGLIRVEDTV